MNSSKQILQIIISDFPIGDFSLNLKKIYEI